MCIKNLLFCAVLLSLFTACSKSETKTSITGTWYFTGSVGMSTPYSATNNLLQPDLTSVYKSETSLKDIKVTFSSDGHYNFFNRTLPEDKGTYLLRDSFLIIQPKESDFIKFNYPAMGRTVSGGYISPGDSLSIPMPPYEPYAGFEYVSDSIVYKIKGGKMSLVTAWLSKYSKPQSTDVDTMLIQSVNYFEK